MRGSLGMKWIIPLVAFVLGLGVALVPLADLQRWNGCVNGSLPHRYATAPYCGFEPQPDWLTGLLVGIVAYFVLAGFVVAQRALAKK